MGKRKVVLDTNILISALGWNGAPHEILRRVVEGEIELFISYEQFEELSRVLDYPRFNFTYEQKARFKALISEIATMVKASVKVTAIKDDPSDNMILECALVANADYVVSGDKHILTLRRFGRIRMVKPKEFLDR
ncbi:MAG TPA: putative toxin-antitoxin system toxin component, PIN family [Candidatus Acidoferrales bacterium]|nr:putative toxin-antitoxin system toxin component, PIN family [Candidatus Acidoferrales bacterium]